MIYTFYSYKGGVGRSMALANVAECLYLQGLNVIVVDWDLESPGLESFFFEPADGEGARGSESSASPLRDVVMVQSELGLIDMLVDYRRSFASMLPPTEEPPESQKAADLSPGENGSDLGGDENTEDSRSGPQEDAQEPRPGREFATTLDERIPSLSPYLVPIRSDDLESLSGRGGSLSLLPAGRRSRKHLFAYAQAVRDLDWDVFDSDYRGKDFFGWFRRKLLQAADVILIDAPTGVGEVGGVCTRHLADFVVSFCAPNHQNLDGIARMLEHWRSAETLDARDHRPLETIVVPARVDRSEPEEVSEFERRFSRLTEKNPLPPALLEQGLRLWDLQIPYRPELSFRERLVIRPEGGPADATEPLEAAYWTLASHLSLLAPEDHAIRRQFARSQKRSPSELLAHLAPSRGKDAGPPADAVALSRGGQQDRIIDETVARPKQVPGARLAAAEPSVPPVAGPKGTGRRHPAAWAWPASGLSLVVLCILYFAARGSRDARTAPDPTRQITPALTAETRPPSFNSPAASGSQPPVQDQADHAPVDIGTSQRLAGGAHPEDPSAPPGLYLRVGFGPSCPRMLNYRKQFLAAGISDAKVVQLKSSGCALVLGPYAADIVEHRRKEHNARHIRGFDSAIVVDERDFDNWL